MDLLTGASDAALVSRLLAYYRGTADLINASLADTPLVLRHFPRGLDQLGSFEITPFGFSANRLLWAIHAKYAVEFHTWAPLPDDEDRLQFARILIMPPAGVDFARVKLAAQALRRLLADVRVQAAVLIDGASGMALWVPFADAPHAIPLRAWLHGACSQAAVRYPDLISTEPNTHHDGRVHVHVSSNAPRRFSAVPYSLRAPNLTAVVPIRWDELDAFDRADGVDADAMSARVEQFGDVFTSEVRAIGVQRFADLATHAYSVPDMATTPGPRGHIITAAIEILYDGKARTAQELLAAALKRKLVPGGTTPHYIYTALFEYIGRQLGRGRKPPIVQDAQRLFRINEPPDDWPDVLPSAPAPAEGVQALCDRIEATSTADDPAAFEVACCDAFARLGFLTQHLGQHRQPDGLADAILGTLGYRVLLECKTAKTIVSQPDAAEAAKFRDAFKADRSVMLGPDFSGELELLGELQTHRVCAMSVGVLQTLLHIGASALEVKSVIEPGYASDLIVDLVWERRHGAAKRVSTVAELIAREGWQTQLTAAEQGGPANAPRLTVDAAMVLVDAALRASGSAQACTRAEVEAAFSWLASSNVSRAVRDGDELVVLRAEIETS
jgi:DNA primase